MNWDTPFSWREIGCIVKYKLAPPPTPTDVQDHAWQTFEWIFQPGVRGCDRQLLLRRHRIGVTIASSPEMGVSAASREYNGF